VSGVGAGVSVVVPCPVKNSKFWSGGGVGSRIFGPSQINFARGNFARITEFYGSTRGITRTVEGMY